MEKFSKTETSIKPKKLNLRISMASDSNDEFIHKSGIDIYYSMGMPFGG